MGSKGVNAIASKFGDTKTSLSNGTSTAAASLTSPTPTYSRTRSTTDQTQATRTRNTTTNEPTKRTRDISSSIDTPTRRVRGDTTTTTTTDTTARRVRGETTSTVSNDIPSRRTRDTTATTTDTPTRRVRDTTTTTTDIPTRRSRDLTSVDTSSAQSYSTQRSRDAPTYSRTRSRDTTTTNVNSANDTTSYIPRSTRLSAYDRKDTGTLDVSGYNSGYGSDARSGYGSDFKSGYNSGYNSGSNYSKYNSYSRNNSNLRDQDTSYRSSYSRENSSYKPYSRENSYLGSDTGGGGSSWRSRVYGTDAQEPNNNSYDNQSTSTNRNKTDATNNHTNNHDASDTSVFREAIDKLAKAAKDDSETKKPDGLSPNAIRVLPIFNPGDVKLKNKAPADFTSASEGSDAEEEHADNSTNSKKVETKDSPNDSASITRPFRHLAAVTPLPTRTNTEGLLPTPTFKLSTRFATNSTEALPTTTAPSKWLKDPDAESKISKSPSPLESISSPANKECRKSVLNMDINPAEQELMRRQQEGKREELRRLRRQRGEETKSLQLGKTPKIEEALVRTSGVGSEETKQNGVIEEDEKSSSEEESKSEKPPVPPSVEKTSSRTRLLERKHSKGKGDGLRSSGSFRRIRERQSSQTSKSSSSSDSESESRLPRSKNSSFSRRRKDGREDMLGSSGDSRPSSRIRTESQSGTPGKRSRNNSESLCKTGSKNNLPATKSGSKTGLSNDTKLSLGPDIDIGESTYTFTIKKRDPQPATKRDSPSQGAIIRVKERKKSSSSSSSDEESSESTNSSDSMGEEGQFFSLAKSKSMKKSKSSFHKLPSTMSNASKDQLHKLGVRTSPDGKENVSRNNSNSNITARRYEENDEDGIVTAKVTITLPNKKRILTESTPMDTEKTILNGAASRSSSRNQIQNDVNTDGLEEFQWPTGSPELPRKKIDEAIASQNGYEEFRWPSKSPELPKKQTNSNENNEEYTGFQWPEGSPELPRRRPLATISNTENNEEEFQWPEGSPELPKRIMPTISTESDFQWPDGSPPLSRKPSYMRTQWDTETETEMTEMEQTEWSDGSPKSGRRPMPQVAEETEDEFNFEWPSSPEMSRRQPFTTQYSGYDTQNEMEGFDWGSSPELPLYKNANYVTQAKNIDELLNEKLFIEENFEQMEKMYGFEQEDKSENASSMKTSRRSSKCSEKGMTEGTTDKEEEEEDEEESAECAEEEQTKDADEEGHEKKNSKESLKEKARNNLSIFLGTS